MACLPGNVPQALHPVAGKPKHPIATVYEARRAHQTDKCC